MNASKRLLAVLACFGLMALLIWPTTASAAWDLGPATALGPAHESNPSVRTPLPPASFTYVWNQVMGFIYNTFRSRERMIQLTLIGVTVGLFIMLRRMPGKV